jgi:hypothetical protein
MFDQARRIHHMRIEFFFFYCPTKEKQKNHSNLNPLSPNH